MNIDLERLKKYYDNKEQLFKYLETKRPEHNERFNRTKDIVAKFLNIEIKEHEENIEIKDNNNDLSIKLNKEIWPYNKFGPKEKDITTGSAIGSNVNLEKHINEDSDQDDNNKNKLKEINRLTWELFQMPNCNRKQEYRIMSNTETVKTEEGKLTVTLSNPDAHFVSNNFFFHFINLLNQLKEDENQEQRSFDDLIGDNERKIPLVLRWDCDGRESLKHRFPLKYLWMWANKDKVIALISLHAGREFCKSKLFGEIIKSIINDSDLAGEISSDIIYKIREDTWDPLNMVNCLDFDEFRLTWRKISDKIKEELGVENNENNGVYNLSRLLNHLLFFSEQDTFRIAEMIETGCQAVILYGPPGTGKTYEAKKVACELVKENEENDKCEKENCEKEDMESEWKKFQKKGWVELTQFHPSYSYEDFIEGIKPKPGDNDKSSIMYSVEDGVFKEFCNRVKADNEGKNKEELKKYVFLIDEINRANLSDVFGEILYSLEYRGEEGKVRLPYSSSMPPNKNEKQENQEEGLFFIPENVYIIGTMNNVDKSLITFDLALRRRFSFVELESDNYKLYSDGLLGDSNIRSEKLKEYIELCNDLNEFINSSQQSSHKNENCYLNLNREHRIGHVYYAKIKDFIPKTENKNDDGEYFEITAMEREKLWDYHIEPLLKEYLGDRAEMEVDKLKNLKNGFIKGKLNEK